MSTHKAIVYSPLPPLELGAAIDRTGMLSCIPLQAALMRLHGFQTTACCPDPSSLPSSLPLVLPWQLERMSPGRVTMLEALGIQCELTILKKDACETPDGEEEKANPSRDSAKGGPC